MLDRDIRHIEMGTLVIVKESPYPELFPVGSRCIIWDVRVGIGAVKPIGVVLDDDYEGDDPKIGWFEKWQLEEYP